MTQDLGGVGPPLIKIKGGRCPPRSLRQLGYLTYATEIRDLHNQKLSKNLELVKQLIIPCLGYHIYFYIKECLKLHLTLLYLSESKLRWFQHFKVI